MASKKDDALSGVIDALVENATRHGGDVTAILDAHAKYKGEQTNEEKATEAADKEAKEQEEGKEANRKQVEDEKAAADKAKADKDNADDKKDGK